MLDQFEADFAATIGIPHCVALASGTAAIHLALRLAGVGPGDEVWTATLTFIGGVAPIQQLGANPVFFDVKPETWTLDTDLLDQELRKAAATGRLPRAVLPTDLYGQSCDLDAILELCRPYGIPVITDSAEAVGTTYRNRSAGDGARMAAFSFNGNKIITTSGGGMLATHDASLAAEARKLSQQAREACLHYEHRTTGYNYRLSNLLAAVGRAQLEVLPQRIRRRREIFDFYRNRLAGLPGLSFMPEAPYGRATRWLSVILLNPAAFGTDRENVRLALEADNIEARPVWKPMHRQPVFETCRRVGGDVSDRLFAEGLCLPSGTAMEEDDLRRVVQIVHGCHLPTPVAR